MKKLLFFSGFFLLLIGNSYAQGVAINNNGSLPNPNAMLHVLNANPTGQGSAGLFEKAFPYAPPAVYTNNPGCELEVRCQVGAVFGMTGLRILNNAVNQNAWTLYTQNAGGAFQLYANGIFKGSFEQATGAYTSVSDARLKSNISSMPNLLSSVMLLQPKTYSYTSDAKHKPQLGFLAQDVEKLFPQIIYNNKMDDGTNTYTMDYAGFGVIAVKAVQEQQKIIEGQQKQINDLKKEIAEIKALLHK